MEFKEKLILDVKYIHNYYSINKYVKYEYSWREKMIYYIDKLNSSSGWYVGPRRSLYSHHRAVIANA